MSPGQAAAAAPQEPRGSPHTLFQVQASNYSEFRPQYAQEVYDIILQHLDAQQRELAVDVATGSGQVLLSIGLTASAPALCGGLVCKLVLSCRD